MLGMDLPAVAPVATAGGAYRVLARKYRPQKFSELIGQDAMVQTLANAIRRDRLAHAFLMTGVRGVGKTSTARLIAKGLNCIGADGQGGPTIDPCGQCDPCVAIAEGRHIDVIEMDAASHTGVDDVREIIEAVRYAAVSARYKIYIIDEVHMLSKNAFNALLKTLEEPPAHVKFLFATTEVNKVPVTVLSRCQRFDLRRITPDLLFSHFSRICGLEGVEAEDGALWMIARAAEGSVRDGLSILDQAIAHADLDGEGVVAAAQVQDMLGLSDGGATRELFGLLLEGKSGPVIDAVRDQHERGVEPLSIVRGLMALAHGIALTRVARGEDPAETPENREAMGRWAQAMGMARIQRLWQLLLKAHEEVARAGDPLEALEMALLRIVHASTLPDPDELARLLAGQGGVMAGNGSGTAPGMPTAPGGAGAAAMTTPPSRQDNVVPLDQPRAASAVSPVPDMRPDPGNWTLEGLAGELSNSGQLMLGSLLRREGRVVSITPGVLTLSRQSRLTDGDAADFARALTATLQSPWVVELSDADGAPTLAEQAAASNAAAEEELRAHPLVAAVIRTFPDAELIRRGGEERGIARDARS
ncbi:DNA polymerase III subunit gamma/tau [Sphingomonas lacunae]|uniref:DNA polymerase III subunit gamma/tau n=1 Tax=Sphingomonas lacunae TaxID=2698828 RepID=A0A6M4AX92_9SPHN|nr:DNA polymerase III subunit gamma/tau [Sphingomonas lacunae]QJQ33703.1 DNA polymerase III subunit gamma/tau [Sphingomonas lacunae]